METSTTLILTSARLGYTIFENQPTVEVLPPRIARRRQVDCLLWNQANDLDSCDRYAHGLRLDLDCAIRLIEARLFEIGEVHRDLGKAPTGEGHTHGLDECEPARRGANLASDGSCNPDISRLQVDIKGDQQIPRSDHARSRGRMQLRPAQVRRQLWAFEPAAPAVFKRRRSGVVGGSLVEINRDSQPLPHRFAGLVREAHTIGQRRTLEWDKRHDIDSSNLVCRLLLH